jgi:hypothetical protein
LPADVLIGLSAGLFAFLGRKEAAMYVPGAVAILVLIFAVLMMLGVVPFTPIVVGALFIGVCLGFVGPYFVILLIVLLRILGAL